MVDFDALNRETQRWKNNQPVRHDDDNGRMGMSPSEWIKYCNRETYKAHNGRYPENNHGM